ncbi:hypothetical protein [Levilactobacillus acidifarinae]|uniref:Uncharacterized protein n=1 Tax=Levilactobacillus acidifarinae DSM 19394 = JCM 15949 TaxID=1423715 RepID=A0A0R1LSS8_9LACO|nr:hypothetical protein [Levilactobacillus acidifarinae]KRK95202.1 hypothetical protein FD25_GL001585 [Levilactobacillus acidifarinae DSM 19394]GEO70319.1 hypothetical protein LAC03_22290 [Levilactobacillus acidifarinae]
MGRKWQRWGLLTTGILLPVVASVLRQINGVKLQLVLAMTMLVVNVYGALVISDPKRPLADFGWAKHRSNALEFCTYLGLEIVVALGLIFWLPSPQSGGIIDILAAFQFFYSSLILLEAGFVKAIRTRYPDGGRRR